MDSRASAYYVAPAVAGAEGIRSFIAVDLQAPVREAVGALQARLARLKADVRWVRPTGMHVTLKFLGPVEPARLERVHTNVVAAVRGRPALQLRVHGLGAFPSWRRPRVLWVGLEGDGLVGLAAAIDTAVQPLDFEPEQRGFTPHVTLGRVNSLRGWPHLEELVKTHLDDDFGVSTVSAVIIYRSTLRPEGAVYAPLWTIPLSQHREGTQS